MKKGVPKFKHLSKAALRTPHFYEDKLFETLGSTAEFEKVTSSVEFLNMLQSASPELHKELCKDLDKDEPLSARMKITVAKYLSRASTRCTPFAAFSSLSVIDVAQAKTLPVIDSQVKFALSLDYQLLGDISPLIPVEKLKFKLNDTLYRCGKTSRFLYRTGNMNSNFLIREVDNSTLLDLVAKNAKSLISFDALTQIISDISTIPTYQIANYLKKLIAEQILLSEAYPVAIGNNETRRIAMLASNSLPALMETMDEIKRYNECDDYNTRINGAKKIYTLLRSTGVKTEDKRMLKLDTYRAIIDGSVDDNIVSSIIACLEFLARFNAGSRGNDLYDFKKRFMNRYEEEEVNLLQALDPDIGIGYGVQSDNVANTLIDGLALPSPHSSWQSNSLSIGDLSKMLHKKLIESINNGYSPIEILDSDIKGDSTCIDRLPPSISAMVKICKIDDKLKLLDLHFSGPSAANLIGRFSHNTEVFDLAKSICDFEQENSDRMIAEISHLSTTGAGNILCRDLFRNARLSYLSADDGSNVIQVSDLTVSVKNNRIVLRSSKTGQEIEPRLTTAHNYHYNTSPVYRFLCDLQGINIVSGLSFSWLGLGQLYDRLPRVTYHDVILSPASWRFSMPLNECKNVADTKKWALTKCLPRLALLIVGDNKLLIDFENDLSVEMFLGELPKNGSIFMEEYISCGDYVTDENGKGYANEFIIPLIKANRKEVAQ